MNHVYKRSGYLEHSHCIMAAPAVDPTPYQLRVLWWWNAVAAIIHLASGFTLVGLSPWDTPCRPATWVSFDVWNTSASEGDLNASCATMNRVTESGPKLHLLMLLALSPLWSGFCHALILCLWSRYLNKLTTGSAPIRWIDYIVSSPPMLVVISVLCGVSDTWLLVEIAHAQIITILIGAVDELIPTVRRTSRIGLFVAGAGYYVVAGWGPALDTFRRSHDYANVPPAIQATIIALFLIFSSFAVVKFVTIIRPQSALICELVFIGLSCTAKVVLTWTTWTGQIARGADGVDAGSVGAAIGVPICVGILCTIIASVLWRRGAAPFPRGRDDISVPLRRNNANIIL
jgi:hypothetical protein